MRLLDRYLLRELLVPLVYILGGFVVFWLTFEMFRELPELQEKRLGAGSIARYYAARVPELLVTVLPMALLLALLHALTNHARHHELTAMRAAGIGLGRICLPHFLVGLALSGALFVLGEFAVPQGLARAEEIRSMRGAESSGPRAVLRNVRFRNARDNRIWLMESFNPDTTEINGLDLEWTLDSGVSRRLKARRGSHSGGQWTFFDVQQFTHEPGVEPQNAARPSRTNQITLPELTETPEDIAVIHKFNSLSGLDAARKPLLSLGELKYLRSHLELNAKDRSKLDTQWHARLAQPWMCLVVVLVAVPFGASSARRNVFVGVASSIFICFAYFITMRFALALGTGGHIPPVVAGWLPNAVFGGAGLGLTRLTR